MMGTLLSASMTSSEIRTLIDFADESSNIFYQIPFEFPEPPMPAAYKLKGMLNLDLRKAKPAYQTSRLSYGPIEVGILLQELSLKYDWHRILGIPKRICLELKDPCGNVIFKECVNFDLGVTTIALRNITIPVSKFSVDILDLMFRDSGGAGYDLRAKFPITGMLVEILVVGVIRAFVAQLSREIEKLLRRVFGGGWLADMLIEIVVHVFKIIDKAIGFASTLIRDILRPFDEILNDILGENVEVPLKKDAFPRQLVLMPAKNSRPEVTLPIQRPPRLQLRQSSLELEIVE